MSQPTAVEARRKPATRIKWALWVASLLAGQYSQADGYNVRAGGQS